MSGPIMHNQRKVGLSVYINRKINMLTNDFYIRLTDKEIEYFRALESKSEVDQYAHKLLNDKL